MAAHGHGGLLPRLFLRPSPTPVHVVVVVCVQNNDPLCLLSFFFFPIKTVYIKVTWKKKRLWLCKLWEGCRPRPLIFLSSRLLCDHDKFFFLFFFLFFKKEKKKNTFHSLGELELMNFYSESRPSPALCFPSFVVWYNDKKKRRKNLSYRKKEKKKLPLDLYSWPRLGQRRILGSINKWLDRWCRRRSAHNRLYLRHILNVLFRSHSCRRWMTPPLSRWERYCSRKNHHHLWSQQTLLDLTIPFFSSLCCKK